MHLPKLQTRLVLVCIKGQRFLADDCGIRRRVLELCLCLGTGPLNRLVLILNWGFCSSAGGGSMRGEQRSSASAESTSQAVSHHRLILVLFGLTASFCWKVSLAIALLFCYLCRNFVPPSLWGGIARSYIVKFS